MAQPRVLIRGGTIPSMEVEPGDLPGDVLVEDSRIVAIAPDLPLDSTDVEVIERVITSWRPASSTRYGVCAKEI